MKKSFAALLLSILFLAACVSAQPDKRAPAKSEKMRSDKLTLGGAKEGKALQLGIKITLPGLEDGRGALIAKAFEEQLSVFETCVNSLIGTKAEVMKLKAEFRITKKGVLEKVKVLSLEPAAPEFSACFLKQSQQIDLGPQPENLKGQMTLGTFTGAGVRPEWGVESQRIRQ